MTEADARTAEPDAVLDLLPPLRRYIASRLNSRHDVDDVVQETVERVLGARQRLEPDTALAYALVVARHVLADRVREDRRARKAAPKVVDLREPVRPDAVLLADEERRALADALAVLTPEHRDQLLAHVLADVPVTELAAASGASPGSTAAQLARTRAKLRLEFVLAMRRAELPTARCRPVLLAVSAGDTRRQHALRAGQHILHCPACSRLSEPLLERRSALAGVLPWLGLGALAALLRKLWQTNPGRVVAGGTAAAAAAATAVVIATSGTDAPPPAPAPPPPPVAAAPVPAAAGPGEVRVVRNGALVLPAPPPDLRALAGEAVRGREVPVASVVADEGLWLGDGRGRVWALLSTAGEESAPRIRPGQRLTFTGTLTAHTPSFATRAGTTGAEGAALLTRQGAHVTIPMSQLRITTG